MNLDLVKGQIKAWKFRLSDHAEEERNNDGIEIREIRQALLSAELLEDYPQDKRGPSCLLLGFDAQNRPIHVVCGLDKNEIVVIITVYVPSMPKWKNPRERNIVI
ncbi:MAG: DUF4258 domain-containing protein [Ignavibacteriae bacterium]|nr:DUF4258 domain-containing protein [Ignavibacteriota bacterium]